MVRLSDSGNILLMSTTQMESTLCFLEGILEHGNIDCDVYKLTLGTSVGVYPEAYPGQILQEVARFIEEYKINFVLVSLIEFGLRRSIGLLRYIKENTSAVVIAGGPYAIEYPDDCILSDSIDIVNYTHGLFLPKLIKNYPDLSCVPNVIYKKGGEIVRNKPAKICYEMDDIPLPQWRLDNEIMLYNSSWHDPGGQDRPYLVWLGATGGAIPVEHHQLPAKHTGVLVVSVGCPINTCEFCSISRMYRKNSELMMESMVEPSRPLRRVSWYSPDNIIQVVKDFIKARPKTEYILFNDNDFSSIPKEHVDIFCSRYKNEIGLPFYCQSTPHLTKSRGRSFISKLVGAGLDTYCIGAESSEDVNKDLYSRGGGDKVVQEAMSILNEFASQGKIHVAVDFINGNAVESRENLVRTIGLIRSFPLPWDMAIHNLTLNSKLELADIIGEKDKQHGGGLSIETSDYHHVRFDNFKPLNEIYLNVVLEWLGGLHDYDNIGRLKRSLVGCMLLPAFRAARDEFDEFDRLVCGKSELFSESYDFFLDDDVYRYFSVNTDVLEFIFDRLRPISYGYHRPYRYSYEWEDLERHPVFR